MEEEQQRREQAGRPTGCARAGAATVAVGRTGTQARHVWAAGLSIDPTADGGNTAVVAELHTAHAGPRSAWECGVEAKRGVTD